MNNKNNKNKLSNPTLWFFGAIGGLIIFSMFKKIPKEEIDLVEAEEVNEVVGAEEEKLPATFTELEEELEKMNPLNLYRASLYFNYLYIYFVDKDKLTIVQFIDIPLIKDILKDSLEELLTKYNNVSIDIFQSYAIYKDYLLNNEDTLDKFIKELLNDEEEKNMYYSLILEFNYKDTFDTVLNVLGTFNLEVVDIETILFLVKALDIILDDSIKLSKEEIENNPNISDLLYYKKAFMIVDIDKNNLVDYEDFRRFIDFILKIFKSKINDLELYTKITEFINFLVLESIPIMNKMISSLDDSYKIQDDNFSFNFKQIVILTQSSEDLTTISNQQGSFYKILIKLSDSKNEIKISDARNIVDILAGTNLAVINLDRFDEIIKNFGKTNNGSIRVDELIDVLLNYEYSRLSEYQIKKYKNDYDNKDKEFGFTEKDLLANFFGTVFFGTTKDKIFLDQNFNIENALEKKDYNSILELIMKKYDYIYDSTIKGKVNINNNNTIDFKEYIMYKISLDNHYDKNRWLFFRETEYYFLFGKILTIPFNEENIRSLIKSSNEDAKEKLFIDLNKQIEYQFKTEPKPITIGLVRKRILDDYELDEISPLKKVAMRFFPVDEYLSKTLGLTDEQIKNDNFILSENNLIRMGSGLY